MAATSVIDFRSPAAGFDQPLAMWHACHERVARMTHMLSRLAEHLKTKPVDEAAGVTATSIRRYFDEAAPRHHDDEEVDLFPTVLKRLRERGESGRAAQVEALIAGLQRDHAEMAVLWQRLRAQLAKVEAGEDPGFADADVEQFTLRYRAHIATEEGPITEALESALTEADLAAIGRAMAERRGVDWDDLVASAPRR